MRMSHTAYRIEMRFIVFPNKQYRTIEGQKLIVCEEMVWDFETEGLITLQLRPDIPELFIGIIAI